MDLQVIQRSESEGHFNYFTERKLIWDSLKSDTTKLSTLMSSLRAQFEDIQANIKSNSDREMNIQMKWTKHLTVIAESLCDSMEALHDYCCIIQTVGKYIYIYELRKNATVDEPSPGLDHNFD